jgi:4-hydroxybenzoate polyprenyltransferase
MVLNDVCDAKLDAVERPERPIPSGRVSKENSLRVGSALLVGGVFIAHVVSWLTSQWQTAQISVALAATIIAYNVGVKSTQFGPLAMGGCRLMNVLLGASVGTNLMTFSESSAAWLFAAGVGIYTAGLTLIARRETENSVGNEHVTGTALILLGLVVVFFLPLSLDEIVISETDWIVLTSCLLLTYIGHLIFAAISEYSRFDIQTAVSRLIQMFVVIDAVVCALAVNWIAGIVVISLYIPMRLIARWTPMT